MYNLDLRHAPQHWLRGMLNPPVRDIMIACRLVWHSDSFTPVAVPDDPEVQVRNPPDSATVGSTPGRQFVFITNARSLNLQHRNARAKGLVCLGDRNRLA